MRKVVALLPMKGNSVRVPGKNLRLFNGRPLYHHIMTSLLGAKAISKIVVNTDSLKITEDIRSHFPQVIIHERPERIRGDNVPMNEVLAYDLSILKEDHDFLQTHSTNPLLLSTTLDTAAEKYFSPGEHDSLFSVTEHRCRFYDHLGGPVNHDPTQLLNTQNLNPLLEENSNIYIFGRTSFENNGNSRIGKKPILFTTSKLESLDIDYEEDFLYAENIARGRRQQ